MSVLISILILGLLVLVHEFGHFIAAKKNGVLVEEFAIGMGPKLFSVTKGETLFSIRAFPIGGMCKMYGEDEEEKIHDSRAFNSKKVYQRIIIIAAGVVMNIILAFLLQFMVTLFDTQGTNIIASVVEDSPAEKTGIEAGDKLISYNNEKIKIFEDASLAIMYAGLNEVPVVFEKPNGQVVEKTIKPFYDEERKGALIGITSEMKAGWFAESTVNLEETKEKIRSIPKITFGEYFSITYRQVLFKVKLVSYGLKDLVARKLTTDDVMGPIGLVTAIGDTYEVGMETGVLYTILRLLDLTILLSANLAVLNILPFPALDGGRLIFLILEGLRGKPIDQTKEAIVHLVGFALLILLSIFIAYNDVLKLLGR